MPQGKKLRYRDAGVNLEAAERSVSSLKEKVKKTFRPEVLGDLGSFGGLFAFNSDKYREPVLVSGTDGVGTKLKLAFKTGIHNTVGIDLVAMCVNDILVSGAEPLFFLDYLAVGELRPELVDEVVEGIAEGCRIAGCALIGGETAEMPGFYPPGEYDMAGFAVGVVEKSQIIDGSAVEPGDVILGLASTGLHANGFSLARKAIFEYGNYNIDSCPEGLNKTLGEEMLLPTRIYVPYILPLLRRSLIRGMAHITGGGIFQNLVRSLPKSCDAVIKKGWKVPNIFDLIQKTGHIDDEEMYRTFNMGIGFVLIVRQVDADAVTLHLEENGIDVYEIGEIMSGRGEARWKK